MPNIFKTNPDENAGKLKGKDYKESLEGDVPAKQASKTTGPHTRPGEPAAPSGSGKRSIGT